MLKTAAKFSKIMNENTALIAGEGILPVEIAKKLHKLQNKTLIIALRDDFEILQPYAGKLIHFKKPDLTRGLKEIKSYGANELIMAGRIPKKIIYCLPFFFDKFTLSILKNSLRDDHSLLGAIVKAFENENIKVIPYWQILPEFLAPSGTLSKRKPDNKELKDIEYAEKILRVTLPLSFGQAVCVADEAVVAVEAMEGTDMMIKRAGNLSKRGVLVKMMKKNQDMRFDLPTVGITTLENMHEAGLTCLAVEAEKTLIMEPEKFFELADKFNIAVLGVESHE